MLVLLEEMYSIFILLIIIFIIIIVTERDRGKILKKIWDAIVVTLSIILMYSIYIRYDTKTYTHKYLQNISNSESKWVETESKGTLNKLLIIPNNPINPNINPSYFSKIILKYSTDSLGYINGNCPNISFAGLTFLNWSQIYTSNIKIDTINKQSKFYIIASPLDLPFLSEVGFDFTIKTNGLIFIKSYNLKPKYL